MLHSCKPMRIVRAVSISSLSLMASVKPLSSQAASEAVWDSIVHLEDTLRLAIPDVPRLCDASGARAQRVSVGDAELYVEEEGTGPPIVLINGGWGSTHHYFHPWFSEAATFARVIYYDQRGCGLSDYNPGDDGYSVDQAVGDLDMLRRALGIDKWVVLGHSYGGFLAQYYTIRHPERVAGLVLVATSPGMWVSLRGSPYKHMTRAEIDKIFEIRSSVSEWGEENGVSEDRVRALSVFNAFLNGDWKRQGLYRPSEERIARLALYEWVHDTLGFRSSIGRTLDRVDFRGAFDENPVPTLVIEGRWDLNWSPDKPAAMQSNHPRAQLAMFDSSAHRPFEDEPNKFFATLRDFVGQLHEVSTEEIDAFRQSVAEWEKAKRASVEYLLRLEDDTRRGYERIADQYSEEWVATASETEFYFNYLQKIGYALYDVERYEEGLEVFAALEQEALARGEGQEIPVYVGRVWQGHVLDLLGRRAEAVVKYREAAELELQGWWRHPQYDLQYEFTPYAETKIETPFERLENVHGG